MSRTRMMPSFIVDLELAGARHAQARPMPRATTAAWLVMPPRVVRMPPGGMHAVDVLGLVSMRQRITVLAGGRLSLGPVWR